MAPDVRDMSDPTDVASDAATDEADDNDDARRIIPRRRREPCCRLIDVLRAALALERGTCGIGGRCGRQGGMRDAWGGKGGGVGRGLLPLLSKEEEEAKGFWTPRMCTMPAPSRVSSSVHGFEAVDTVDGARATVVAASCQLYTATLGRTDAGGCAEEVNAPNALAMLFRSESRHVSIVTGWESVCDSPGFAYERSRRSFHRLLFRGVVASVDGCCVPGSGRVTGSGVSFGLRSERGVWIQGTSSPDPFRLR